jgi:23S rRNA (cytidine1920-2'-O)/16S rRNA (cytidine1409-2'-O)-methyltransferase
MKERLDKLLVDRNITQSREKARAYIISGTITVDGEKVMKPSTLVELTADIQLKLRRSGYVSRGGLKLEGALEDFHIDVSGVFCLDIGASTGGFTDCLLRHGALEVIALDVGKNQIDYRLRKDPRVIVVEKFNARFIDNLKLDRIPGIVTVDVSFISLRLILPPLHAILDERSKLIALIKPQFELEKPYRRFSGVVIEKSLHQKILSKLDDFFHAAGYGVLGYTFSRIRGPKGNIEFFVYLRCGSVEPARKDGNEIERVVTEAHDYHFSTHEGGT